jgi:maltooligosyltrehalose trehalohydrolase
MLRYFGPAAADDRVLLVNFGRDLPMQPAPEPLLAPPGPGGWRLLWSSEDPAYGGTGSPPPQRPGMAWGLPGRSAIVLGAG